jgi:hypothetical protein
LVVGGWKIIEVQCAQVVGRGHGVEALLTGVVQAEHGIEVFGELAVGAAPVGVEVLLWCSLAGGGGIGVEVLRILVIGDPIRIEVTRIIGGEIRLKIVRRVIALEQVKKAGIDVIRWVILRDRRIAVIIRENTRPLTLPRRVWRLAPWSVWHGWAGGCPVQDRRVNRLKSRG